MDAAADSPVMWPLRSGGMRRRVLGFFVLTYLISWLCWGIGSYLGTDTAGWSVLSTLAGFGPLLAGGFYSFRDGEARSWARQAVHWRVDGRWWLVAILVAPLLSLLGYGVFLWVTDATMQITSDPLYILYPVLFFYILLLRGGFGEEMGWRGYALPYLQTKYNTTIAALLIGVGWAGWHLPLFFIQDTQQAGSFSIYLVGVIGLSIVLAWLYTRTRGSVLLVAVFHAQWNVFDSGALFSMQATETIIAPAASAVVIWLAALSIIALNQDVMLSIQERPILLDGIFESNNR